MFGSGGTTNVFGGKTTFGQSNATVASIFGGGGSFASSNSLWSGGNTNESAFGSSAFGKLY